MKYDKGERTECGFTCLSHRPLLRAWKDRRKALESAPHPELDLSICLETETELNTSMEEERTNHRGEA